MPLHSRQYCIEGRNDAARVMHQPEQKSQRFPKLILPCPTASHFARAPGNWQMPADQILSGLDPQEAGESQILCTLRIERLGLSVRVWRGMDDRVWLRLDRLPAPRK
jgi:hypothetical protein